MAARLGASKEWLLLGSELAVGCEEPLSTLSADFASNKHITFEKIKILDENYSSFRRVRSDSNCFYRSFIFSYLEQVIKMEGADEVFRMLDTLEPLKQAYERLRWPYNLEEFHEEFTMLIYHLLSLKEISGSSRHAELLELSQQENALDRILSFLRLVAAIKITTQNKHFKPILATRELNSLDEYCRTAVVPMGAEADEVHLVALVKALGVPLRVVLFDQSQFSSPITREVNPDDNLPAPSYQESSAESSVTGSWRKFMYSSEIGIKETRRLVYDHGRPPGFGKGLR